MTPMKVLLGLAVLVFTHNLSHASISVVPTQPAVLPGYTAYGIYWDGHGIQDWTGAEIEADLTQGTFYENLSGSSSGAAPSSAFIGFVPELEFDTYFGVIDDGTAGFRGTAGAISCEDAGPGICNVIEATHIDVGWFNTATDDTGVVKIGNFTVSNDAMGVWSIFAGGVSSGVQTDGVIIPEPTSLALFALVCPLLMRRRRRPMRFTYPLAS